MSNYDLPDENNRRATVVYWEDGDRSSDVSCFLFDGRAGDYTAEPAYLDMMWALKNTGEKDAGERMEQVNDALAELAEDGFFIMDYVCENREDLLAVDDYTEDYVIDIDGDIWTVDNVITTDLAWQE